MQTSLARPNLAVGRLILCSAAWGSNVVGEQLAGHHLIGASLIAVGLYLTTGGKRV